jgi:adenylosuccinate synthase
LDNLPEIKIATAYLLDGKPLESFPGIIFLNSDVGAKHLIKSFYYCLLADLETLEKATIQYETLPGWQTDISKCRQFSDLPINAQNYIKVIEKYLEVPSKYDNLGSDYHINYLVLSLFLFLNF